jgi:putative membrane protein
MRKEIEIFLIKWGVNILTLLVVVRLVPGLSLNNFVSAACAALVLGFLNAVVRPVLLLFTLPLSFLSLGFFTLLVNAFLFSLAGKVVSGFVIESFWSAFWAALLFTIVSAILNIFFVPDRSRRVFMYKRGFEQRREEAREKSNVIDIEAEIRE